MGKNLPPFLRPSNLLRRNFSTKTLQTTSTPPPPTPPPPRKQPHLPASDKKTKKNSLQPSRSKPLPPSRKSKPIFTSPSLDDAKKTYDYILSTSPFPLDNHHHNSLLQSFSQLSTLDGSIEFLSYMRKKRPSFTPDRDTYNVLFCQPWRWWCYDGAIAGKVVELMVADGVMPDHSTVNLAVRSLCSTGREERAADLCKELSLQCVVADHSMVDFGVRMLCSMGWVEHAAELCKELPTMKNALPPERSTYNFLVRQLCKTVSLGSVYEFIDKMRDSLSMKPDITTYTTLIDYACSSKNLREATKLFGVLGAAGFKHDAYLYNIIMKGYCTLNQGNDVVGVYKDMLEKGIEPDVVTYNTMIFGLSKVGRLEEAKKYLAVMAEMGHSPDALTYTTIMNGMCRKGDTIGALRLLGEMEEKGCEPNSCTYNTLLHGLCKKRLLDKGVELYEVMKSKEMKLEPASYATFVRMLCREDRIAEAYEVYDYVVESKSLTDVAAYEALENELKWLKKAKAKAKGIA